MEVTADMSSIEKNLIQKAEMQRSPINGSIELLPLCNMNCNMCYVRLSPQEAEKQGRIRTLQEWMSIGEQMRDAGVLFLLLTGGEPLLYPDFKELYLGLRSMGMVLTINTNGTLINREWAEFFSKYKPRRINITLYGACNETYETLCHYPDGFERVIEGIHLLRDYEVPVKMGGSATIINQNEIRKIIEIGQELNVPVTIDTYMMPAIRERNKEYQFQSRLSPEEAGRLRIMSLKAEMGEQRFSEFRNQTLWEIDHILPEPDQKQMNCHAGKSSFTINWQGEMRPCVIMSEPAMSVFEHGFEKAWKYIVSETDKILLSSKCSSCNLRPICRNCAACALLEAGSYDAVPEYMCRYAQESEKQLRLCREQESM